MSAVEWKELGSLCEIKGRIGFRGYTRDDQVEKGEGAISLSPANIVDSRLCYDDSTYISWSKYNESPEIMVFNDDLIFCKTASVGKVSMVENLPCEATINPQLVVLKNICVNSKYLYYCLCGNKVQDEVKAMAGVGSVPNVSQTKLANILIPIPSLAKQQEIVSHLDTFTTLISNLESELDMRRKQYEHYRNQLLDFEGVEGVEWKTLGELSLKITDGAHSSPKSTNEGYYMPSVKDMTDNGFDFSDCKIISKEDYEVLKRIGCQPNLNDILIAKDGSMLKYVFVVKEKLDIVVLSSIAIITPKIELVMPEYLVCYLKQSSFREIVIRDYSSKGGVPRIILKNFRKIVIPIPSLSTQQEIVSKLDAFENLIQSLEQEIKLRKQQYEYYREKLLTFEKD